MWSLLAFNNCSRFCIRLARSSAFAERNWPWPWFFSCSFSGWGSSMFGRVIFLGRTFFSGVFRLIRYWCWFGAICASVVELLQLRLALWIFLHLLLDGGLSRLLYWLLSRLPSWLLSWLRGSLWGSLRWWWSLLSLWLLSLIRILVAVIWCGHKIYDGAHLFSIESSILHHIGHTLHTLVIFFLFFFLLLRIDNRLLLRLRCSVGFLIFFVLSLLLLHLVVVFLDSDHLINLFLSFFLLDLNDLRDLLLFFLDNLLDSLDWFFANLHLLGTVSVLDHKYLFELVFSLYLGCGTHIDQVFNLVGFAYLLRGCDGMLVRLFWRIYLERLARVLTVMDDLCARLPRYDISLRLLSGNDRAATTMAMATFMLDSVGLFAWCLCYHFLDCLAILNLGGLWDMMLMLMVWTMFYSRVRRFRSVVSMLCDSCLFCTGYYNETVIELVQRLR